MADAPKSKITDKTGKGHVNHKADILWVKDTLEKLGRYNPPGERHAFIDKELHEAIENYQRDSGLKSDGFLSPMGETEKTLRVELIRLGEE